MKNLCVAILFIFSLIANAAAQPPGASRRAISSGANSMSFIDMQKTFQRPDESFKRKEDTLRKQFEAKGLAWPAKYLYIRSFKYDSQLEVWVKNDAAEQYKLFKTFKVCALAGTLGPKRMEGDYQVPEGFYYINEFNPRSQYYLSLGINYPNASDKVLSDSLRPGSAIYIHGSCVTVGCIPILDTQIDELYILAAHAKNQGQDFIPVHIFPIRYNVPRSVAFLSNLTKDDPYLKKFADRLEDAFEYFEQKKQVPVVMISDKGEYSIASAVARKVPEDKKAPKPKREPVKHRTRPIAVVADVVHQWPQFPGGGNAFMKYLDDLGHDMVPFLPENVKKAFVQVEFIVDTDGVPVNIKVLKGSTDQDFIDELITRLEKMPTWTPAMLHDKAVAKKMIQTITVD